MSAILPVKAQPVLPAAPKQQPNQNIITAVQEATKAHSKTEKAPS